MAVLGQTPATQDVGNLLFPPGVIVPSILDEADMVGFLLCDGRRVSKTTYAALFAKVASKFEVTPGVDPGDGLFRVPPMHESGGNGSASRMPAGVDPATSDVVGTLAGQLGHTHAAGSLQAAAHTHGASGLTLNDHGHGYSLSSTHLHGLFNDTQRFEDVNDDITQGTFPTLTGFADANPDWYNTTTENPGVTGSIFGPGALGLGGNVDSAGPHSLSGSTGANDPAYLTLMFYIKT